MRQRFLDRMEEALTKMRASIQSGRLKDKAVAQRRRGRLQERYWRAAAAFEIKIAKRKRPKSEPSKGVTLQPFATVDGRVDRRPHPALKGLNNSTAQGALVVRHVTTCCTYGYVANERRRVRQVPFTEFRPGNPGW